MITLEGYEIEEMRSINHIMTVELQFDRPVTQEEARDYLSRVLTKANELEAQAQKEDVKEYLEKTKNSLEELTFAFPQKEETANESLEIANENPKIANEEAFDAEVRAEFQKAKKPEKTEGVLKVPVTEEEIAGMKQKKLEEEAKAEKYKKIDWDKACALKKAGWSNKQIAEELHANEGTIGAMIYKHLEKYNAGERKVKYEEKAEV